MTTSRASALAASHSTSHHSRPSCRRCTLQTTKASTNSLQHVRRITHSRTHHDLLKHHTQRPHQHHHRHNGNARRSPHLPNTLPTFVSAPIEIQEAMTKIYMASPSPWPNDWVGAASPLLSPSPSTKSLLPSNPSQTSPQNPHKPIPNS
jgi:hypothetical protein